MQQTIDISPEKVAPIAAAGIRFLNLATTLHPGNLKQQLAVVEVFLAGLSSGELVLATPAPPPVESDAKEPDKKPAGPDQTGQELGGPKTQAPLIDEDELMRELVKQDEDTGAGDKESG